MCGLHRLLDPLFPLFLSRFFRNGKSSVSQFETIFAVDEEDQIDIHDVKVH